LVFLGCRIFQPKAVSIDEEALNFIKQLSGNTVTNKKKANQWLTSQYETSQNKLTGVIN
jgi:hypothetical protein